ncbi:hypothetical protein D5E86_24175 [Vibrio parahaemolyticus]|nr:hypothetical protein D5E86_24175 [Vibrio parahaemolyticus]
MKKPGIICNIGVIHLTKHLRRIHNARHIGLVLASVFTASYFKFSGLRCSPLNAALCAYEENRHGSG